MLLLLCACVDPGAFMAEPETPIQFPEIEWPVMIDRHHLRDGWYSLEGTNGGVVQDIQPGCTFLAVQAARTAHRKDGTGRWGRLLSVTFTDRTSAGSGLHLWMTVGDSMYTRTWLNSMNRFVVYGVTGERLRIEGVGDRRDDRRFSQTFQWRREVVGSDFVFDWRMADTCPSPDR